MKTAFRPAQRRARSGPRGLLRVAVFFAAVAFFFSVFSTAFPSGKANPKTPRIRLKVRTIHTAKSPATPSGQSAKAFPMWGPAGYHIVQSSQRITKKWREEVAALSQKVVAYLPDDALVIRASPPQMSRISRVKGMHWIGRYLPEYKVSPSLGSLDELSRLELFSPGETCRLLVSVFPGCDLSQIVSAIESFGCEAELAYPGRMRSYLRVHATKNRIPSIAQLEDVEWIEPFQPLVLTGRTSVEPLAAEPDVQVQIINAPSAWERGLTGAGQVVAVCDTGLDVGINGTPMHDDLEGRIGSAYALGRPGLWNDPHGHGTHVAGTAVGSGLLSDGEFKAPAYESRLVFQSGYVSDDDPLGGIPVNLYELYAQVHSETAARIHNNSWGSPDRGAYSLFSVQTDEFVWDHKDFLIVFAAGNDGVDVDGDGVIDEGSLYSPATSKNCLAVGASENVRETGGLSGYTWGLLGFLEGNWTASPITDDYVSDNENGMAAFSSRGPCVDGRIKPDLVAPGTDLISCRSQDPQGKQSTELMSWGVYDDYYVYMGGTSMAAPAVAGCAALVRQFYADAEGVENPSAALIKATLVNGAAEMSPGQYGTGYEQEMPLAPNSAEGWGRVDLKESLFPNEPAELRFVEEVAGLETGQSKTYQFVVGTPDVPFRATMVYSDYPASPAAAVTLVNDLDMTVSLAGQTFYPNGKYAPDDINNVESVNIPGPQPGIYEVTISGRNVPHGPQPFALVVSCGRATGQAVVSLDKSAYGQADSTMTVTLIDADLTGSTSLSLTVSSDSNPIGVTVALSPSAVSPSVFRGLVVLTTSPPSGPEPKLWVSHDDTVLASYLDPDYGGTGGREVSAAATVDLVSPQIFDVSASDATDDSATVNWTCSEPTTGVVSYGGAPPLDSVAVDRTLADAHSVALGGLSENQTYRFAIQARDAAGNQVTDDNGGNLYMFHTRYTVFRFRDDMEIGEGGWTHYGDLDQWEYGTPTYENGPSLAHSGNFCWGTRLDGYLEHDDFMIGGIRHEYLVSPEIDVGSSSKLTFWHWHDLLADSLFGIYDYAYVEVSADGGEWENVTPNWDGAFTGASPGWIEEEVDVSAFAGQRVQIRFHIEVESWFDYLGPDYQYAGWYVDDMAVSSTKSFGEPTLTLSKSYCTTAVPLGVTLIDGDLNLDPDRVDVAEVKGHSTTEAVTETLLLTETAPNTGVFSGNAYLGTGSPTPGDGILQVRDGDVVVVSYQEVGNSPLSPAAVEATAVVDLTAPTIADLSVSAPSTNQATVAFTTEPTANAKISYWGPDGKELSQTSYRRTADRSFVLETLAENALYHFRLTVTDEASNTASYSSPPDDFSFGTKAEVIKASNAFDGTPSTWDFSADEVWEVGIPTFGPPAAHSPPNCWGTDLDGFYPINCDASLTSGWLTLPQNPQMHFWHWYSIDELGWEGAYGTVEVSDDGNSWVAASDGAFYAGASGDWIPETIDLSPWAAQRIKIRFRLWSQEAEIVLYYYAGWYIDDVSISNVVPYGRGTLVFNRAVYSLNTPVVITLIDAHLNADPSSRDDCLITLSSSLESVTIRLTETDVWSGKFTGQILLKQGPPAVPDEFLQVSTTDSITARYHDADDSTGYARDETATAALDTMPPKITQIVVSEVTDTSALVTWTTDVDAIGSVSHAESPSGPFDRTLTETSYSRQHSVRMTDLSENLAYYFKVLSADPAENVRVDDNGGSLYEIRTMVRWEFCRDSFDREDAGWAHEGLGDVWEWGVPRYGVASAHSDPDCWATNLTGTYPGQIDASLVSPPLQLKAGSQLSFYHWYSINEYLLDDGKGAVEVKVGQGDWQPLDGAEFTGATQSWEEQRLDLSSYAEQAVNVRFRLQANQSIDFFYPGWYIDDVALSCLRPFGFGVVQFDRQVYSVPGTLIVAVKDGHLNLDLSAKDTVTVSATSTSDPLGLSIQLVETGENTALFRGELPLRHVTDPTSPGLAVQYGDDVTVHYLDSDNSLGQTNVEAIATARVWAPPQSPPVLTISYGADPATVTISWPVEHGRAYRLYSCDDLLGEPPTWQRVSGVIEPQAPSSMRYSESVSPLSKKRFFRLELW